MQGSIERHMSRRVIEVLPDGSVLNHSLSIVELRRNRDGEIVEAKISPFSAEKAFTTYHDRPLLLTRTPDGISLSVTPV